jgi:hypothetical protein
MLIKSNKTFLCYVLLITAIFVLLILIAASDFRGTDQYWYMADVEKLLQGGGKTTNFLFPPQIISTEALKQGPFIHNLLNLYLVLPLSRVFGAFSGWVITNVIASILTASLMAWLVAKITDLWLSVLAYTIYLFLPLTIWQTAQPLAEATIAPFVALSIVAYVLADNDKRLWPLVTFFACVTYYCRASFLPMFLAIPVVYTLQNQPIRFSTIAWMFGFSAFFMIAVIAKQMLFPGCIPVTFQSLINNAIPGLTDNMYAYYSLSPRPIQLWPFLTKLTANLKYQLLSPWKYQLFYFPFNVLAAFSARCFIAQKSKLEVRVTHCIAILLLIHIATIIIVQNQFRYLLPITPALVVGGIAGLSKIRNLRKERGRFRLILGLLIILIIADIPLVIYLRREGLSEKLLRTELKKMFDSTIPQDASLMVEGRTNEHQVLAYVLRPRTVVCVKSGYSQDSYEMMRDKAQVKWLLCSLKSPLLNLFGTSSPPVLTDFPYRFRAYALFRLETDISEPVKSGNLQIGTELNPPF